MSRKPNDDLAELDDAAFETQLARRAKRRKLAVLTMIGVVAVVVAAVAVFLLTRPAPLCRSDDVAAVLSHGRLDALHLACDFPAPLDQALASLADAPPEYRALLGLRFVVEHPSFVLEPCAGAIRGLAEAEQVAPHQKWDTFAEHCPLAVFPFASERDIRASSVPRLALALAVYNGLRPTDSSSASRLARFVLTAR